jgi:hypothetical protein
MGIRMPFSTQNVRARFARVPTIAFALSLFAVLLAPFSAYAAAPTISGTPKTWVYVGSPYSFTPTASDPDSTSLRFTVTNKPAWASFSTTTGTLSGTPTAVGYYTNIRIAVTDGTSTSTLAFSIRVTSRNNTAPTISGSPASSVVVGSSYTFQPTANDAQGDPLRFSIVNQPAWATFDKLTGRLSGTPTAANVGTYANITISVTDGSPKVSLAPFSITVSSSGSTNKPPTISGTPPTSVKAGSAYAFTPTATDPEGKTLAFSITNKPAWATFSTTTGKLSGTPSSAQTGTYSNIGIKVSDGSLTASLPTFAIVVSSTTTTGSATLSWTPPTRNTDGSTLTNLAGYRILYGTSAGALNKSIQIANAGTSRYVVENLTAGTWYFSVRAYSTSGAESTNANTASKTIP